MNGRKRVGLNQGVVVELKEEISNAFPFPSRRYLGVYVEEDNRPVLYLFTEDFVSNNVVFTLTGDVSKLGRGITFIYDTDIRPLHTIFSTMIDGSNCWLPYTPNQFSRARARAVYLKPDWFALPPPALKLGVLIKYWLLAPFRFFCK